MHHIVSGNGFEISLNFVPRGGGGVHQYANNK
jgi:hypothetical protein